MIPLDASAGETALVFQRCRRQASKDDVTYSESGNTMDGESYPRNSRQDLSKDRAVDVGQAKVTSGMTVGQLSVVHPQQMQNRGVKVVHIDLIPNNLPAHIIGRAVNDSPFDSATS